MITQEFEECISCRKVDATVNIPHGDYDFICPSCQDTMNKRYEEWQKSILRLEPIFKAIKSVGFITKEDKKILMNEIGSDNNGGY